MAEALQGGKGCGASLQLRRECRLQLRTHRQQSDESSAKFPGRNGEESQPAAGSGTSRGRSASSSPRQAVLKHVLVFIPGLVNWNLLSENWKNPTRTNRIGCRGWNCTRIRASKGRCPTIRRPGREEKGVMERWGALQKRSSPLRHYPIAPLLHWGTWWSRRSCNLTMS